MARQIHGIVQKAQDIDHVSTASSAKQDKVAALATFARDMKRRQPLADVVTFSHTGDSWTCCQIGQCVSGSPNVFFFGRSERASSSPFVLF